MKNIQEPYLGEHEGRSYIRKVNLEDGAHYFGHCRNANVARWDEKDGRFWYIRQKFNYEYIESIHCPEDDDGFDLFYARTKVDFRSVKTPNHAGVDL
jgi:hypothetical protein